MPGVAVLIFNLGWDMVGYQNPELGYVLWAVAAFLLLVPAVYWIVNVMRECNELKQQLEESERKRKESETQNGRLTERLQQTATERDQLRVENEHLEERRAALQEDREIFEEAVRRSVLPDPSATYFKDEAIHIFDLARRRTIAKGKTFEDCDIYGPAVVAVMEGTDFDDCHFAEAGDMSSLVWEPSVNRSDHIGVVGLAGCIFRRCNFVRVGLLTKIDFGQGGNVEGQQDDATSL